MGAGAEYRPLSIPPELRLLIRTLTQEATCVAFDLHKRHVA